MLFLKTHLRKAWQFSLFMDICAANFIQQKHLLDPDVAVTHGNVSSTDGLRTSAHDAVRCLHL